MKKSEATHENLTFRNRGTATSALRMSNSAGMTSSGAAELVQMWWLFAVRGGLACAFAIVLLFSASLLGTLFFDPVLLVLLSLLLGSYVFGNAVLLGIGGMYGWEHRLRWWGLICCEAVFSLALACYIAFSLMITSGSLAWLAALHAVGTGCFQAVMAVRLRGHRVAVLLLSGSTVWSLSAGALFLTHRHENVRTLALWLSGFDFLFGAVLLTLGIWLHQQGSFPTLTDSPTGVDHGIR